MSFDSLGDRIKGQYEDRTRYLLPRRTFTIIRLDGKAFHTLTRGCIRPFDGTVKDAMTAAAIRVVQEAQGAKLAYIQSDEISIVLTDFDTITTEAWFDGNVQKIVSVAASFASVEFSKVFGRAGVFDARVFTIPDPVEVLNYIIWRQKDALRNSVSACAQAVFSAKQLHGKSIADMKEMLIREQVDWLDVPQHYRNGWCVVRQQRADAPVERWSWAPDFAIPIFTEHREYLTSRWAISDEEAGS